MKEDFLHFLWYTQNYTLDNLVTTENELIQIRDQGAWNHDAGPDFSNAHIKIGDQEWFGNVEIHIRSSDWILHKHQFDHAYDSVILHVVLEDDKPIFNTKKQSIKTLELSNRINQNILHQYQYLMENKYWIACENQIPSIDPLLIKINLEDKLIERLQSKTLEIKQALHRQHQDWEEVFYQFLAKSFGYKINALPFYMLAQQCPISILNKVKNDLFKIQALLFGQAGFLERDFEEDYPKKLKKEYAFQKLKYHLEPLQFSIWKFMRLRPANFPSLRIAQFAQLVYQSDNLFSKALAATTLKEYEHMFELKMADYWKSHFKFDKISIDRKKTFGKNSIHLILINTICPFLFLYGHHRKQQKYIDKALFLLQSIPAEKNKITQSFLNIGFPMDSAFESQAVLNLKKQYCDKRKCTQCKIGYEILKKKTVKE